MKSNSKTKKVAFALVGAIVFGSGAYLIAADHIDAPAVKGTTADITDLYAFESPVTSANMVFVVNTQGLLTPSATGAAAFDPDVLLQVKIDNSAAPDAIEDLVLQITFENGKVQVYGPVAPSETGLNSTVVTSALKVEGPVTAYGAAPVNTTGNGVTVFAGPRDDPFFFDLNQYHAIIGGTASGFNTQGTDAFAGTNVMAVVVELPKSTLGSGSSVNVWTTSSRKQ